MADHEISIAEKAGKSPGTPIYIGEERRASVHLRLFLYDETTCEERTLPSIEELVLARQTKKKLWLNVDGVHDVKLIQRIGELFSLHPLILEDILNTHQRPKFEDYGEVLYVVLKMLAYRRDRQVVTSEQVSVVIGDHFLLTFQERRDGDSFGQVRERLKGGKGRMRKEAVDYLAYSLLDSIVDAYFVVLEDLGSRIDALREHLAVGKVNAIPHEAHELRRELIVTRRALFPARAVMDNLRTSDNPLVGEGTRLFLRDIVDHSIRAAEDLEAEDDILSGVFDTSLHLMSQRMNEVMKTLTFTATIFMPMTFVASIYGMNFRHMPELGWQWGYPFALLAMVGVGIGMGVYFLRKRWK